MERTKVKLKDMRPSDRNVRRHPQEQVDELIRNVQAFGQYRDIVLASDGEILIGNGLFEALVALGWEEADARILPEDTSDVDKRRLMLADNRIFELGGTDREAVEEAIKAIMDEVGEVDVPGFDQEAINAILEPIDIDSLFTPAPAHEGGGNPKPKGMVCPHCGEWIDL